VRDPIELRIPDPCLVLLVGAAGSGKSTFGARHFAPEEVLSSDAFRGLIAGDPTDQRATSPAFAALHRAARRRLAGRLLTVVDATSVKPADRRPLLRVAADTGVPAVAIVLALPEGVVLARNEARGRLAVPEPAVRRHLAGLAASLREPGLAAEGFTEVLILREPDEVDAVRLVRVATADGSGRTAPAVGGGPTRASSSRLRSARWRRP
jgi:protein phosphatase